MCCKRISFFIHNTVEPYKVSDIDLSKLKDFKTEKKKTASIHYKVPSPLPNRASGEVDLTVGSFLSFKAQ